MVEPKILTKKRFAQMVEQKVRSLEIPYMDACLEICDELEYPPEDVGRLISPPLYEKIRSEAVRLRLIKDEDSQTACLPI